MAGLEKEQRGLEVKKSRHGAARKITGLVLLDIDQIYIGPAGEKQRNTNWENAATEYSDYSGKITELGKAMKSFVEKKRTEPSLVEEAKNKFADIKSDSVQQLLAGILLHNTDLRNTDSFTEYQKFSKQSGKIINEMGFGGKKYKEIQDLSFEIAISLVLQGKLNLKSTSQQKQRQM